MHDFKEIGKEYKECSICGLSEPYATTNNEPCQSPKRPTPFGLLERFVNWWHLRQARKAAEKFKLDFEHRCCFRHQVANIGSGLKSGNGEIVLVPMRSGKIAEYKVTSERYNMAFEDTGQRNWFFAFQGYAS